MSGLANVVTPPTWQPHVYPTPAEWVAWFHAQNREGQEVLAARIIENIEIASRCFQANHEGAVEHLNVLLAERARQQAEEA